METMAVTHEAGLQPPLQPLRTTTAQQQTEPTAPQLAGSATMPVLSTTTAPPSASALASTSALPATGAPSATATTAGPTAAERLRAYHELEAWLKPYKEEIMGVYVNVLVGYKPVHAAVFYLSYTALLWYGSVSQPPSARPSSPCAALLPTHGPPPH